MMDKQLKQRLREVHADKMIVKRDGTVEYRQFYFYRHGMTAEKFTAGIVRSLKALGIVATVLNEEDHWAPWPRDSYFSTTIRPALSIRSYEDGGGVDGRI